MPRTKLPLTLLSGVALSMLAVGCGQPQTSGGRPPPKPSTSTTTAAAKPKPKASSGSKKAIDPKTLGKIAVSVKFEGDETKNKKLKMSSDPACASAHEQEAYQERFVRNENMTMANAVVYISEGDDAWELPDTPKEKALLDQVGCVYKPHVLAVRTKQEIEFKNSDKTLHNVHPTPKKNKAFNKATQANSSIEKSFRREEVGIPVKCDVHPWMKSYISVFKHPWFAVTPKGDGVGTIEGVPAGKYKVMAWHERLKETKAMEVEVKAGETASLTLSF